MYNQTVLSTEHYTDRLFSFKLERPEQLRFNSGEFIMIGLPKEDGKPLLRAYSIASPSWHEELEFYSIKVPDGPLTSRLQSIKPGDKVIVGKKSTGTLILDALTPAKNLYLFSTGTGLAPFASVIRDPETYERYDKVILTHTCRDVAELDYGFKLVQDIKDDEILSEVVGDKLIHFTSTTREHSSQMGRITNLAEDGTLFEKTGTTPLNPAVDRVMICGSMEMLQDTKAMCEAAGLVEGSVSRPGEFVIEKAFVD